MVIANCDAVCYTLHTFSLMELGKIADKYWHMAETVGHSFVPNRVTFVWCYVLRARARVCVCNVTPRSECTEVCDR